MKLLGHLMWRWKHTLLADNRADLTDMAEAVKFLHSATGGESYLWELLPRFRKELFEWRRSVWTLRSLAVRLKKEKPRGKGAEGVRDPDLSVEDADRTFRKYVGMLMPWVRVETHPTTGQELPLSARTYQGIRLDVTDPRRPHPQVLKEWEDHRPFLQDHLDMFWQGVFGSMVTEDITPVCGRCGAVLPPTKSKRPTRGAYCGDCRYKAWAEKKGGAKPGMTADEMLAARRKTEAKRKKKYRDDLKKLEDR